MTSPLRIIFNAIPLLSPLTGIGQYTYQLAQRLQEDQNININFFYAAYWDDKLRNQPIPNIINIKTLIKKCLPNSYRLARRLQQYYFNHGINSGVNAVYHEPNFLPFNFDGPTVITAHDLSWIRYPETHPIERLRTMNRYFEAGLAKAHHIITDSEFIKQEIIQVFGINPNKIQAIALGVEPIFIPQTADTTQDVLSQYKLKHAQYILSVGTLEPRKNIKNTIDAYMQLPATTRKAYPLVIVGMKGWHKSKLEKQLTPLIQAEEIRLIGYLPRQDLATLTAGALTLVYPSLYEGFGLPPLEAMSCGVPVITSNTSSLPEVVNNGGILVDPLDVNAINLALNTLIHDQELRKTYAQQAYTQSLNFSWQRCTQETINVYRKVV